ncbi:peptidase [Paraneptunicella aestuarii]|uniref:pesticin C-terminus-like muramidase n=1 Tax=Paraneptunicella aestuarii TaxID=2831148 RepID=UPI001E285FAD|nr:pesticin C-terminus-like muramidase [Paraneptunicella aestuarii]UAA39179.1 peptidase [Paraneptunicella aestuarii]
MIDFTFIAELEGSRRRGYVPDPDGSQSGVTIACSFDIGQCDEYEIKRAFSPELASKLLPYASLKKQEALACIHALPLEISEQEEAEINQFSHTQAEQRLRKLWQESGAKTDFDDLPDECQTVVASVAFQYGNLATRTPNFWRQVTSGKWQEALANLRDFGDRYGTRRHKEAQLLERIVHRV